MKAKTRKTTLKRTALFLLTLAFLMALFTACSDIQKASPLDKFSGSEVMLTGGKQMESACLKDVTVTREGENEVLRFSFDGADVPQYTLRVLPCPERIQLTLLGEIRSEAEMPAAESSDPLLWGGFFKEESNTTPFSCYWNIKSDVQFMALEMEGELKVTLKKTDAPLEKGNYCVLLNAFDEYENGFIGVDTGLTPTLGTAGEGTEKTLVSQAFASREEAETYALSMNTNLAVLLPEKTAYVAVVDGDQLPIIDTEANLTAVERDPVLPDSGKAETELVLQRVRYLAEDPEGTLLLAHPEESAEETVETLIRQSTSGERSRLDLKKDFHSIRKAEYASSGRYLALIDETEDAKTLLVYDFDTERFVGLQETGYNGDTLDFVWNETSQTLYTLLGSDGPVLCRLDFSEGKTVVNKTKIIAQSGTKLFAKGDTAFYTAKDEEEGEKVFLYDFAQDKENAFCDGKCIAVSPDGDIIVVERPSSEENLSNIFCVDVATGAEIVIKEKIALQEVIYCGDGRRILFCEKNDEEEYPFRLETFWTEKNMVQTSAKLRTGDIRLGRDGSTLMLTDEVTFHGKDIPMTYRWKLEG